jgi:hypothetical protein
MAAEKFYLPTASTHFFQMFHFHLAQSFKEVEEDDEIKGTKIEWMKKCIHHESEDQGCQIFLGT